MDILTQIENYQPYNEQEERDKGLILDCLRAFEDVFTRENALAHMTASAWVVNERFDRVLMAYFAVVPEARGQGAGSLALAALLERYRGRCVFLEIEALEPEAGNYAQRVRRKQFYLRGGLSDCGLSVQVFGVNMEILSSGPPVSFEEYVDFYRKVFGERYAAFLNIRCLEERKQNG
mgnify:CR=1 FL=1